MGGIAHVSLITGEVTVIKAADEEEQREFARFLCRTGYVDKALEAYKVEIRAGAKG